MREAIRHIPASSNDGARYTPTLVHVDVTRNHHVLADAAHEHAVWYEAVPAYGLPASADPIAYCWPVSGHNVAIVGMLSISRLHRLMAALLREGACSIAGLDTDVQLHTSVADRVEVAA
ncbi:MAG TPA: hypothetical protein VHJ19_03020 [Gammaproteobacteria bacterium]|nr:hypothetical protein [Gammaproteobacteria bacterium]